MSPKLQNKLYKKYSDLFIDRKEPATKSCMCWGCDVGDGWFTLLNILCQSIADHVKTLDKKKKIPPVKFLQVKEKFSLLRIYVENGDEIVNNMVNFAETMSGHICETCGVFGVNVGKTTVGWIKTLCKDCAKKEGKRWKKLKI